MTNPRWWLIPAAIIIAVVAATAGAASDPVYVEDSPAVADLAAHADDLRRQNRLMDAVGQYQQIIEEYPQRVIEREPRVYTSASRWANRKLRSDQSLLAAYRQAYEPIAQRLFDDAMRGGADAVALTKLVRQYGLCRSGLEASLHLAAVSVQDGRLANAATVLDEVVDHPDLDTAQRRYHMLAAAVGLFGGDGMRLAKHRQALRQLGETERLAQIDHWSTRIRRPKDGPALDAAGETPDVTIPRPLGTPLWSRTLNTQTRTVQTPFSNRVRRRIMTPSSGLGQPVVEGETLYLVDISTVMALDRNSGRSLWSYRAALTTPTTRRMVPVVPASEPRSVCVTGRRVLAIVGHAPSSLRGQSQTGALVCLDASDGSEKWRITPGQLDGALADAYFFGTPVVDGDRVYVAVRRMQRTRFQDAYLVAVDLVDGSLRWRRHLASAVLQSNVPGQRHLPTQWKVHGGRLYVADLLGVVACIDGRDGTVVWLSTQAGVARQPSQVMRRTAAPMLIGAGLLVPGFGVGQPPQLLDPQTGLLIRSLEDKQWTTAAYFMPVGHHVLSVGQSLYKIDGRTLKLLAHRNLQRPIDASTYAAVTATRVLLPVKTQLMELNSTDLNELGVYPIVEPGSVTALEGQVLIAGTRSIHSYMNWTQAYDRLKGQIEQQPEDPSPSLALAHVSLAARQWRHVLEGADAAREALRRRAIRQAASGEINDDGDVQREVFRQLLWFVQPDRIDDGETRAAMFDRVAAVANGPDDNVAFHMALGRFLEQASRPVEAMEHYQLILADPELSSQLYRWPQGSRGAALEARLRQARLIDQNPGIYDRYETAAALQLDRLRADSRTTVQPFVELTRQYPLSRSAIEALILAAHKFAEAGDHEQAIISLRRAYDKTRQPQIAQRIVGSLVQLHIKTDRPRRARRWLLTAQREHPGLPLARDGRLVAAKDWLAELSDGSLSVRMPVLNLPLVNAGLISGTLLTPTHRANVDQPTDVLVFRDGQKLRFHEGPNLKLKWSAQLHTESVELLSLSPSQVLVHLRDRHQIVAFDTATGDRLWKPIQIKSLLRDIELDRAPGSAQDAALRGFDKLHRRLMAVGNPGPDAAHIARLVHQGPYPLAVNERMICIADRLGRLVAVDRETGRQRWQLICPVNLVTAIQLKDDTLVVVGTSSIGGTTQRSMLLALDPLTGQQRFMPIDLATPLWVGLHDSGTILCVAANRIESYAATDGRVVWRSELGKNRLTRQVYQSQDQLLVAETSGGVRVVDAVTGRRIDQPIEAAGRNQRLRSAQHADEQWHLLFAQKAVAVARDGKIRWRDGIGVDHKILLGQWISDKYVVLLHRIGGIPAVRNVPKGPGPHLVIKRPVRMRTNNYRLYVLDRRHGNIVGEYDLNRLKTPIDVNKSRLVGNRLLLTTTDLTRVLAGGEASSP